ncbi:MAG: hypothetical protein EXS15_03785 [Phycisphaerales bacterium]|nr:hypothetical protein [Phycisphaerales bacterium]
MKQQGFPSQGFPSRISAGLVCALLLCQSCADPFALTPTDVAGDVDGGIESDSTTDIHTQILRTPLKTVTLPVDDGTTDGIAVIQWRLSDDHALLDAFWNAHPPSEISAETQARLAANGLRVAQVSYGDVPSALVELGGTFANVRSWLGQATTWTQIASLPIRGQVAVVVDGATRRFEDGLFQLLLRGWTVPLESGAVTDLEIVPAFIRGGAVPGGRTLRREPFHSAGFEAAMPRGSALLIMGISPGWSSKKQSTGSSTGPPALPPPTIGELILTDSNRQTHALQLRSVLLIVPLIQAHHFPVESPVASPISENADGSQSNTTAR